MQQGLNSAQVIESRNTYGSNTLPSKRLKTAREFFMETFEDRLNQILLGMMILFLVLAVFGQGSFSEPIGIAVVLIAIACINTSTGLKSQESTKRLQDATNVHYCNILRNGEIDHLNSTEIVVGDVVKIQSGEAIYADGYLVEGEISVDNSVLNGETIECKKKPIRGFTYQEKAQITGEDYVDQNSLFAGQVVLDGEGYMVVIKVGTSTVNGQTILTMEELEETKTSLEMQLDDLAEQINKFGYAGAAIILVALLASEILAVGGFSAFLGLGWLTIVTKVLAIATTALTIIVAAVPEGLPLIISLITAQNAKAMIKKNVLAKHTNKIPEAGNIQLLCTDKTGTLTKGILEPVHNVALDGKEIGKNSSLYQDFLINICLNTSALYDNSDGIVGGNATDRALLGMADVADFKHVQTTKVDKRLSFNSVNKYSAVQLGTRGKIRTYYKGAPERLLDFAKQYVDEKGKLHKIDKTKVQKILDDFTSKAMRVIATGYSEQKIGDTLPSDLVLTSLVAIRDDVRLEVPEAVKKMHQAGVQVMMVTGDVLATAKAIARDSGLLTAKDDLTISASEFDQYTDARVKELLPRIKVIARATPQTKLRIVKLAQELGLCVGMTGDGTNDAPALKAADVGFSMGSGTDVCKEAGDIIITDDNFVSITQAVLLGRTFMHNVKKFLKFQLPINVSLVILSVIYPIFWGIEAIVATQILIINIVMDSLNSLSFGGEPPKDEYMLEQPVAKGSKLLDKATLTQVAVSVEVIVLLFMATCLPQIRNFFGTPEQYQTVRFALLVIASTINGFNIRTDSLNLFKGISKNPNFVKIALGIFLGTILIGQFGGEALGTAPLSLAQWLAIFGLGLLTIPFDLVRKLCQN